MVRVDVPVRHESGMPKGTLEAPLARHRIPATWFAATPQAIAVWRVTSRMEHSGDLSLKHYL